MRSILVFLLCITYSNSLAQCDTSYIFPFKFGITRFEVIIQGNLKTNLKSSEINKIGIGGYWKKVSYLPNDSFRYTSYSFEILKNECLTGQDLSLHLRFIDDALYQMEVTMYYYPNELYLCDEALKRFIDEFSKYYWSYDYIRTNSDTKEQIGKGRDFYPFASPYPTEKEKMKQLAVGYEMHDLDMKTFKKTDDATIYEFTIEFTDLKFTPFDMREY